MAKTEIKTVGFCAICERDIAASKDKLVLVHHGYKRPGHGFIQGDCLCAKASPYELSCEPLKYYLVMLRPSLLRDEDFLRRLQNGDITELPKALYTSRGEAPKIEIYKSTETDMCRQYEWKRLLNSRIYETTRSIEALNKEIARIEGYISSWSLKPLREEARPQAADRVYEYGGYVLRSAANVKTWQIHNADGSLAKEQVYYTRRDAVRGVRNLQSAARTGAK